jgi:hypothetical protein
MDTKTNLMTDEQVILETKPAWTALIIAPIISIILGCLFFVLGLSMLNKSGYWGFLGILGFAIAVGGLNSILSGFRGMTTKFVVTDKRIIAKTGLLSHHEWEVLVSSLTSISIKQSLTAQVWHYGTLVLTNVGGKEMQFPSISNPNTVKEKLISLIGTKADLDDKENGMKSVPVVTSSSPATSPAEPMPAPLPTAPGTPRVVDLRPAEERQKEREAQRDLGDDESIARQLLGLIRQSNDEYGRDMDAYQKTRAHAREIGEYLCANGGDPRMKRIGYRIKALGGNTRILEDFWDGICGWMV